MTNVKAFGRRLWQTDPWLTGASIAMLAALAGATVGLAVDERYVTGMPAWLKPAKFAISTATYMLTLAWVFTYLPEWAKTRRIVGRTTAALLVMEVAIIDLQAWRGTTSHFNVSTPLDTMLFSLMGFGIFLQTLMSVAVAVALWRQTFADRALGWALRFGLIITIIGAMTGGLMTRPTSAQLDQARATHQLTVVGAHTVGANDGGPGLRGTGWSLEHGDLRIPHFLGLHTLQLLPIVVVLLARMGLAETRRIRLTLVIAASHFSLFVILLWQALRGQSFIRPDEATLVALASWAALTVAATWIVVARHEATRVAVNAY